MTNTEGTLQINFVPGSKDAACRNDALSVVYTHSDEDRPTVLAFHSPGQEAKLRPAYEAAIEAAGPYTGHDWIESVKTAAQRQMRAAIA